MKSAALIALLAAAGAFAAAPYQLTSTELTALAAHAPAALQATLKTVVDKPAPPPVGDLHDYVSYARYYWPDPAKPDGLPYVSRDGQHNREQVARGDRGRIGDFGEIVPRLAAAWSVNRDEAAARRAGEWLRAWFLTPATRMNPHLDYAQVRLGHNHNLGSPAGVLDARGFADVIDAIRLLHGSPAFAAGEEDALRAWFAAYLGWLTTARNAQNEHGAANNHGSWFLAQAIPIARFAGRDDLAREWCEGDKARLAAQIRPDGSQPEEIRRVDGLGYSAFNLEAQFHVVRLAAGLDIDLWNYTAPNGASLRPTAPACASRWTSCAPTTRRRKNGPPRRTKSCGPASSTRCCNRPSCFRPGRRQSRRAPGARPGGKDFEGLRLRGLVAQRPPRGESRRPCS